MPWAQPKPARLINILCVHVCNGQLAVSQDYLVIFLTDKVLQYLELKALPRGVRTHVLFKRRVSSNGVSKRGSTSFGKVMEVECVPVYRLLDWQTAPRNEAIVESSTI